MDCIVQFTHWTTKTTRYNTPEFRGHSGKLWVPLRPAFQSCDGESEK
jgi:hypothetical protein